MRKTYQTVLCRTYILRFSCFRFYSQFCRKGFFLGHQKTDGRTQDFFGRQSEVAVLVKQEKPSSNCDEAGIEKTFRAKETVKNLSDFASSNTATSLFVLSVLFLTLSKVFWEGHHRTNGRTRDFLGRQSEEALLQTLMKLGFDFWMKKKLIFEADVVTVLDLAVLREGT